MINRLLTASFGIIISVALPVTSEAQQSQDVLADVGDCAEIESRDERLECYETRVQQALETRETGETSDSGDSGETGETGETGSAARPAASRRSTDNAGLPSSRPERELADEIVATVTAVRELEPNSLLVTLDNGQVWRQNRPQRYVLDVGTEVILRPTRWGPAYRLTDPNRGGFIQVQRVR